MDNNNNERVESYIPGWATVLMLILFFPAGMIMTWKTRWSLAAKIVVTSIFGIMILFYMLLVIAFAMSQPTSNVKSNTSTNVSERINETASKSASEAIESIDGLENSFKDLEDTVSGIKETTSQKNAIKSAKSYLDFMPYSREGLIKQLEYSKYETEDAEYAVDNCNADWNEQAVKSAKKYLDFTSYSREGLIDQLEYEGFTTEQAIHGVEANGF